MISRTDPGFLAVCRGDAPADLLLTGGRVVNVLARTIDPGPVALHGGRVASVGLEVEARETVDLAGSIVAPGLIDAHMHLESTMMLPSQFVRLALPRGTTGVVCDPHEIANVAGVRGIRFLMEESAGLPMHIMFAASSCVPASPLETAGATLTADDLRPLLQEDRVVALAEMMNFPGVVAGVPDVLEKVRAGLEARMVDGHCPGLGGAALQAYVAAGITSDHECTTPEEALEKCRLGMRIYIREGSAARNLEALAPVVDAVNAWRFCFCTDDRHPGDLMEQGHVDHVLRRAITHGIDPATAFALGSLHVAEHYRLPDLGAVAPGRRADLIVFDDLHAPVARQVYFGGRLVAEDGALLEPLPARSVDTAGLTGSVRLPGDLDEAALASQASTGVTRIRVIGMDPHQLITEDLHEEATVVDGRYVADVGRDVLKLAVIERHRGTGNVGVGFVRGFGIERGAIASTVAHDSHNVVVVGANDRDMLVAARALGDAGGGQCVADDGQVRALLPLPLAGLLSDEPAEQVVARQRELLAASRGIGCPLEDPFMPLSFLSLTVIPKLKLSDRGLVDVDRFEVVPLGAPPAPSGSES